MINFPFLPVEGLHEFNLDWFLNKFKELSEEWDETKAAWLALKEYVETFFDELDVQEEINNKIDEMYQDGSLEIILSTLIHADIPVFVDSIADMTDSHNIYVLSSTGHIWSFKDGAFFDTGVNYTMGLESVTGSLTHITTNNISQYNDFNNLTTNNIYAIDDTAILLMDNKPNSLIYNIPAQLIDLSFSKKNGLSGGRLQILKSIREGYLYIRGQWGNTWYSWELLTPNNKIITSTGTIPYSNANDFPDNSHLFLDGGITSEQIANLPEYGNACCVITNTSLDANAKIQIYISNKKTYTRIKWASWSKWILNTTSGTIITPNNIEKFSNADTFLGNSISNISSTFSESQIQNLPVYGDVQVIHTLSDYPSSDGGGTVGLQTSLSNEGNIYFRQKYAERYYPWYRAGFTGTSHPVILGSTTNIKTPYRNADTFPVNQEVCCSGAVTPEQVSNLPAYGTPVFILTFSYTNDSVVGGRIQIAFLTEVGTIFYRTAWGEQYHSWSTLTGDYFIETIVNPLNKLTNNSVIFAFGDSMMSNTGGSTNIPTLIADIVNCAVHNYSVPSARFDETYTTNNIITQIQNAPSNIIPTHIFINGGTNDAGFSTDITNYISSVNNCITLLKEKYPTSNITYLSPFPRTSFTTGLQYYGGIAAHLFVQNECDTINCFKTPVVPKINIPNFTNDYKDGTHLTDAGKKIAAKFIAQYYL